MKINKSKNRENYRDKSNAYVHLLSYWKEPYGFLKYFYSSKICIHTFPIIYINIHIPSVVFFLATILKW